MSRIWREVQMESDRQRKEAPSIGAVATVCRSLQQRWTQLHSLTKSLLVEDVLTRYCLSLSVSCLGSYNPDACTLLCIFQRPSLRDKCVKNWRLKKAEITASAMNVFRPTASVSCDCSLHLSTAGTRLHREIRPSLTNKVMQCVLGFGAELLHNSGNKSQIPHMKGIIGSHTCKAWAGDYLGEKKNPCRVINSWPLVKHSLCILMCGIYPSVSQLWIKKTERKKGVSAITQIVKGCYLFGAKTAFIS